MKNDITNINDIRLLVDGFYGKVRADDLLGAIFHEVIRDRWPAHLEKMYRFWQTILLEEHTYSGSPFAPHAGLPLEAAHFERWVALFRQTLHEHFEGEKTDEASWRAEKMAELFLYKIVSIRDHNGVV